MVATAAPPRETINTGMERPIEAHEVRLALARAKDGKASGFDSIPVEVLRNNTAINCLHKLFNKCFQSCLAPNIWARGVINPIPKDSSKDPRVPLHYRGITLASCIYKLYCSILNSRLVIWAEQNGLVEDEQNGFRKGRSCQDHLTSITNIIDTRRQYNQSTFVAFVDFRKAYDHIDRLRLWARLRQLGMPQKFLSVLQSLYSNVECSVRINGVCTEWFPVKIGLKQGCILSPVLFNLYINGLVERLKRSGLGVSVDGLKVALLIYADDLAILAESEEDLKAMLNELHKWSEEFAMDVNVEKTKIVHFRRGPATPRTEEVFLYGMKPIQVVSQYRYLGLVLTECLDWSVTAKYVAQASQRALGLLIAKSKAHGGLPYTVFTKLYDALVQPIMDYGAAIWGHKPHSCIQAVQNRAMRFHLGVGRRTLRCWAQNPKGSATR